MNRPIHINFFLRTEQRSAAPVRLRVMAPLCAGFLAGAFLVFAVVLRGMLNTKRSDLLALSIEQERLQAPHRDYLVLRKRADAVEAGLQQLAVYRNSRLEWGMVLDRLPDPIPGTVQLSELRHDYPSLPQSMPSGPVPAPTNRVETGRVTLSGRTIDADSVSAMLTAFRGPEFDATFAQAEVPPGAFRQDIRRASSDVPALLFEINILCHPRRFE